MAKELEHTSNVGLEGALSSPSPSWAGGFDDELIAYEILSRLPVKSLVRFRCVCKSWLALTSDPKFAREHASRAGSRLKLLETVNPTRSIDFRAILDDDDRVDYAVQPEVPSLCVLGSCNGLICREEVGLICQEEVDDGLILQQDEEEVEGEEEKVEKEDEEEDEEEEEEKEEKENEEEEDEEENDDDLDLVIWNPSIQDTYKLPKIKKICREFYGFGYDSTNEDYKVIIGLINSESGRDWETGSDWEAESDWETEIRASNPPTATLAVFTSKTGSWKIVKNLNNVGECYGPGRLLNGALHWLEHSFSRFTIISFDLAEEKFQGLLSPPDICTTERTIDVGIGTTIGNSLFLYVYDWGRHELQTGIAITIWVMKEYGVNESWTRTVQIPSLSLSPHLEFRYRPILILENGKVLMKRISHSTLTWILENGKKVSKMSSERRQLVLYDPEENCQKEYRRLLHDYDYRNSPVLYLETLVSPNIGS